MKLIPYGKQSIDHKDLYSVKKSLFAEKITTGNFVKRFENKIKNFTKSKYAVSCSSGTAALHLAFSSINIKPGDIVITPSINFISTCNILELLRAKIYLSDVDPITGQITPELLTECIKKNKLKKIKAVVVMYLGGHIYNNLLFFKLKKKYKFLIIEDSCHALGSGYKYKKKLYNIGSCKHADISTFSFHPLKSITTGEGGAMTTNNSSFYKKALLFRSHGIERTRNHWNYQINQPGLNYRLSDINCSLGISQLEKIKFFLKRRADIVKKYEFLLSSLKEKRLISFLPKLISGYSSNHLFILNINFKKMRVTKNMFFKYLIKNKIMCQYHYIPIYKFNYFKKLSKKLVNTEKYFNNSISLPIFYELKEEEQVKVVNIIFNFFKNNENKN